MFPAFYAGLNTVIHSGPHNQVKLENSPALKTTKGQQKGHKEKSKQDSVFKCFLLSLKFFPLNLNQTFPPKLQDSFLPQLQNKHVCLTINCDTCRKVVYLGSIIFRVTNNDYYYLFMVWSIVSGESICPKFPKPTVTCSNVLFCLNNNQRSSDLQLISTTIGLLQLYWYNCICCPI